MACSSTAGKLIVLTRCLQESMLNNGKKHDGSLVSQFFCMSSKNSLDPEGQSPLSLPNHNPLASSTISYASSLLLRPHHTMPPS